MTPIAAGYDNIRLIRRKIAIARLGIANKGSRAVRDAAVFELACLTEDLAIAVQDFADAGFERHIVDLLDQHKDTVP